VTSPARPLADRLSAGTEVHPDRLGWAPDGDPLPPPPGATIGAALLAAAHRDPGQVAYYLFDDRAELTRLSMAEVLHRAAGAAAVIRDGGVRRGDAVVIALDTGPDLLAAFFGCVLLDAVPVLTEAAPAGRRTAAWADRVRYLAATAAARCLVVHADAVAGAAAACPGLATRTPPFPILPDWRGGPAASPADLAFVQFTSGTTARPRGIAVTHAALIANARALGRASGIRQGDLVLGWLPLFHDMGLVGVALGPALNGLPAALLPPLTFLFRPQRWLWAIHHLRGTVSAAPNFAYQLLTRVDDESLSGLDLTSWRLAFNGAEQVQASTIAQWQRRMGRYGFRAASMCPVYGMAEAALAVTAPAPGTLPVVDRIGRGELARSGRAVAARGATDTTEVVSVGHPLPGYQVRVTGPDGRDLPPRRQGQILVSGPSVSTGYLGPAGRARCPGRDGWLHTGDLGYLADGQLFVTGRDKEILIKAGRNYHPHDLEAAAATVAGLRGHAVIAAGVRDAAAGTERITLAAETPVREPERLRTLRRAIEDVVLDRVGIRPDAVIFVKPGALPRTTSGKLRRALAAEMIAAGTLPTHQVTPQCPAAQGPPAQGPPAQGPPAQGPAADAPPGTPT
jgi:acyl-CoA synthetase (AMP-forming)/AMP-acid ligase II